MSYIDQNEWRQHTREIEHKLIEKIQQRPRPQESEYAWARREQRQESAELPPAFQLPDPRSYDPETGEFHEVRIAPRPQQSARAARFRDTHLYGPPPPRPPRLYDQLGTADGQRLAPPPNAILLDQRALNEGKRVEATPATRHPYNGYQDYYRQDDQMAYDDDLRTQEQPSFTRARTVMTPNGPMAVPARAAPTGSSPRAQERAARRQAVMSQGAARPQGAVQPGPPVDTRVSFTNPEQHAQQLTPAQKKRLRKKRAKLGQTASNQVAPQNPQTNGTAVHPTPNLSPREQRKECAHETMAHLRNGYVFRLICTQSPWPHIGQPHMMRLQSEDGSEIFVGWWRNDE